MLTPEQIDDWLYEVLSGSEEEMVSRLKEQVISSFVSNGELRAKDYGELADLARSNNDAINDLIASYTPRINAEVMQKVNSILKECDANSYRLLSSKYGGLSPAGSTMYFKMMSQQTAIGMSEVIARNNVHMGQRANDLWYRISADAIAQSNQGLADMDKIINDAIKEFAKQGIDKIQYATRADDIDVALKRHMRTQINQAAGRMILERINEAGHTLVQTTAHGGARPDHESWQGKAFSLTGAQVIDDVAYPDFYEVTGYGTVTGLMGANCRHFFDVYFPDITELPEIPEVLDNGMTNDEYYEATQKQRYFEREIRKTKQEIHILQLANKQGVSFVPQIEAARIRLGQKQTKLREFCIANGLTRTSKREKAYGIGMQPRALTSPKWISKGQMVASSDYMIVMPGGEHSRFIEGSIIDVKSNFAGYGSEKGKELRVRYRLADQYGGDPEKWKHLAGDGSIFDPSDGRIRRAEIHWMEEGSIGAVEFWFKRWRDK